MHVDSDVKITLREMKMLCKVESISSSLYLIAIDLFADPSKQNRKLLPARAFEFQIARVDFLIEMMKFIEVMHVAVGEVVDFLVSVLSV